MAESLVSLTSVKRKMSLNLETVGGRLTLLSFQRGMDLFGSRGKHYFKPELNPHFTRNYLRDAKMKSKIASRTDEPKRYSFTDYLKTFVPEAAKKPSDSKPQGVGKEIAKEALESFRASHVNKESHPKPRPKCRVFSCACHLTMRDRSRIIRA